MQAIGNAFLAKQKAAKILYCTSEVFTNELIESIQKRNTPYFRNRFRRIDLLLIDDIQFIAGRESTQEEFFHTFNALYSAGKQVVLTSDRPPSEIKKLEERLKSRFEGGMISDIQNPDIDLREAILTSKAAFQGQEVPVEVLRYIAQSCSGSVRDLEGCLVRITTRSKISNEAVTVELAKKVIGSSPVENRPASAKKVMDLVANFFGIKVSDLKSGNRQARFVQPRQICMYLLRKELGLPFERIAELLEKKDHTTILHGVDKVEKSVVNSEQLREWVRQLRNHLN
jgi:chromosomal replication initiator protein